MSEMQEPKKQSKLKLTYIVTAVAISCLMLGASFAMILGGTSTPNIPTIIQPGSQVIGASYVIFKDSSNCYARNGTTGEITYSSTDASTVINLAINDTDTSPTSDGSPGGKVFITAGEYLLTTPIFILRAYINLEGEGFGYWDEGAEGPGMSKLKVASNINAIVIENIVNPPPAGKSIVGVTISNFYIYGYNLTNGKSAIYTGDTKSLVVENVMFQNWNYGVLLTYADATWIRHSTFLYGNVGIYAQPSGLFGATDVQISNNYIDNNIGTAIDCPGNRSIITGNEIGHQPAAIRVVGRNNIINDNNIYLVKWGISIDGPYNIINGNSLYIEAGNGMNLTNLYNVLSDNMITLGGAGSGYGLSCTAASANAITSNSFFSDSGAGDSLIYLDIDSWSNQISNNVFNGHVNVAAMNGAGFGPTHSYIHFNTGYVNDATWYTERYAITSVNGTVNSLVITHGLAFTPLVVLVTCDHNAGDCYVDTITSTHFTIHFANQPGGTWWEFSWYAGA